MSTATMCKVCGERHSPRDPHRFSAVAPKVQVRQPGPLKKPDADRHHDNNHDDRSDGRRQKRKDVAVEQKPDDAGHGQNDDQRDKVHTELTPLHGKGSFDRVAYQREYMRRRRAEAKKR